MMQNQQWMPCMNELDSLDGQDFRIWAPALAVERLEFKTNAIRQLFAGCGNDWEETFYRHLAISFGFKINSLPFELLAKSLPLKIVRQHCPSIFQTEALLFGQAGMLDNNFSDPYPQELLNEYQFFRTKYCLVPGPGSIWKFMRLRPPNFPTVRISQFAGFICMARARFFDLLEVGSLSEVMDLLKIAASGYWDTHYVFDKPTTCQKKILGTSCIRLLIINGLAPFLFFYGIEKGQTANCERALNFLQQLGGERNVHIDRWKEVGFPTDNAMQTQALLHLKQFYCDKRRCLECRIGSRLLSS